MTLFSLVGEILLKDNNTKQKLEEIEGAGSKTGLTLDGAFSKVGSALLKLGAVVGVTMGFKSLFDKASAGQQTMAQMEAVLKSTGDASGMTKNQLVALADAQSKVTTFSKGTNMATENLLLTFTNIGQKVFPDALKSVNDMSQALGQDTKSSAIQLGKALNDPIKGVTALSRVGVTFNAQQKEQIKSMVEAGNVAGAQKIILQELQKEFGGSAEAAGKTFAGQLTILRNQLTGVGVGIVSKLLPPLTTLVTTINNHMPQIQAVIGNVTNFIGNAINALMPTFESIIQDVIKIAENVFPKLSGSSGNLGKQLTDLAKNGLNIIKGVFDWLAQHGEVVRAAIAGVAGAFAVMKIAGIASDMMKMVGAAKDLVNGFKTLREAGAGANTIMKVLFGLNPMALAIGIGITLLAAIAYEVITHWTQVKTFFIGLWNSIKTTFNGIKTSIEGAWNSVKTTTSNVWNAIVSSITGFINGIKNTITTIFTAIASFFTSTWNTIQNTFNTVVNAIVTFVNTTFGGMISDVKIIFGDFQAMFKAVWDAIKNIFLGTILLILDLVTGNFNKLKSDAQAIWNNIKDDFQTVWLAIKVIFITTLDLIRDTITTIWNSIKSITESLWNGLKEFLSSLWEGIKSVASSAWNGLKDAVISIVTSVVDTAKSIWNGLLSWFESLPGRLYNAGSSMFNSLKSGISSVLGTITSVVQNGFNGAINFITSLPNKAVTWGKDFINGLINGIKNKIGDVGSAVSGVADKIRSILHFSVPDEGPLTDYETWMPDFMTGLANGIDSNKFKVTDKIKELAGNMKIDAAANISASASNTNESSDKNVNNSKDSTSKQPIILQLVLQNAKIIAEWLIDDINQLQGTMQLSNSRLNLGRR
ncbi:phage tail length tape measure family protein [Clostridium neuense]|uniref:Phage tail length tape measure family protein n=1 Tax=Clostridium neuense TaxID=1728934 RepID=A0ABW8TG77_9CLOT